MIAKEIKKPQPLRFHSRTTAEKARRSRRLPEISPEAAIAIAAKVAPHELALVLPRVLELRHQGTLLERGQEEPEGGQQAVAPAGME